MSIYSAWIKDNVVGPGTGQCAEITAQMASAFPELRRVRGHYHCFAWGAREHWWLEALDGQVIDPTAMQFPSKGFGMYVEFGGEEPTGMCPNCGEYIYGGGELCSERCHIEYVAYVNNPW